MTGRQVLTRGLQGALPLGSPAPACRHAILNMWQMPLLSMFLQCASCWWRFNCLLRCAAWCWPVYALALTAYSKAVVQRNHGAKRLQSFEECMRFEGVRQSRAPAVASCVCVRAAGRKPVRLM